MRLERPNSSRENLGNSLLKRRFYVLLEAAVIIDAAIFHPLCTNTFYFHVYNRLDRNGNGEETNAENCVQKDKLWYVFDLHENIIRHTLTICIN